MSSEYEEYKPAPVPLVISEIPRYLDDELHRIAWLKETRKAESIFAVEGSAVGFVIDFPPGTWNQMYIGDTEVVDIPDGSWDPVTGSYTAPYDGIYSATHEIMFYNITGLGQGTITCYAGIGKNGANPPGSFRQVEIPLGLTSATVQVTDWEALSAGDTIEFWGEAVNAGSQTQLCDVAALARINREF